MTAAFLPPAPDWDASSAPKDGLSSCLRDLALWFGLEGRSASEASELESESEVGGRSPGWAGAESRFAMAACFLALAAARRASRVRSLAVLVLVLVALMVEGPAAGASLEESSSELSSEEDSSSLEVGISSSFSCR